MNIELFITFLSVLDKLNDCELTRIIVSKWMDVVWFWPTRCSLPHSLSFVSPNESIYQSSRLTYFN